MRRRLSVMLTVPLSLALLLGLILAAYHVGQADAFDRGMAAGVEYQAWFCENTVTP